MRQRQLAPGLAVDLGGQWGGDTHNRFLALVEELGLERFASHYDGEGLFRWRNEARRAGLGADFDATLLFFDPDDLPLSADERREAAAVEAHFRRLVASIDPEEPWRSPDAAALDTITAEAWLRELGASDAARLPLQWLARVGGSGGFELHQVSMLHLAWTQAAAPQHEVPEAWLLRGGAGQVAERLAADLGAALRCGCPVVAIHQDSDAAEVITADGDRHRCGAVVVAMPPGQRQRLRFEPSLPADLAALHQRWPMGAMVKVLAVYRRAFWRADGCNGLALGERAWLELTADSSPPEAEPGVLAGFIAADRALAFGRMTPVEQRTCLLAELESLWGPEAGHPLDLIWHDWCAEPWIGGAFTAFPLPGTWTTFGDAWRRPHGRVVWAGTEMARRWPGYFEGAIRAGEAAAAAVMADQDRSMRR
jgi:monoamine oxidase